MYHVWYVFDPAQAYVHKYTLKSQIQTLEHYLKRSVPESSMTLVSVASFLWLRILLSLRAYRLACSLGNKANKGQLFFGGIDSSFFHSYFTDMFLGQAYLYLRRKLF